MRGGLYASKNQYFNEVDQNLDMCDSFCNNNDDLLTSGTRVKNDNKKLNLTNSAERLKP